MGDAGNVADAARTLFGAHERCAVARPDNGRIDRRSAFLPASDVTQKADMRRERLAVVIDAERVELLTYGRGERGERRALGSASPDDAGASEVADAIERPIEGRACASA